MKRLSPKEKIEQLKQNHKKLRGFDLSEDAILINLKKLEAEKTMKFVSQNVPNFPEQLDLIAYLEEQEQKKKAVSVMKPKKTQKGNK